MSRLISGLPGNLPAGIECAWQQSGGHDFQLKKFIAVMKEQ